MSQGCHGTLSFKCCVEGITCSCLVTGKMLASKLCSAFSGVTIEQQRGFATLKDISIRLKSVKNIQKITKSMKMVSAAKYAKAERELRVRHLPHLFSCRMCKAVVNAGSRRKREVELEPQTFLFSNYALTGEVRLTFAHNRNLFFWFLFVYRLHLVQDIEKSYIETLKNASLPTCDATSVHFIDPESLLRHQWDYQYSAKASFKIQLIPSFHLLSFS